MKPIVSQVGAAKNSRPAHAFAADLDDRIAAGAAGWLKKITRMGGLSLFEVRPTD